MKIYVASSWRNTQQPSVIRALRDAGHDVYDFRHPSSEDHGFSWREIDPDWQRWSPDRFREALEHSAAQRGFRNDIRALANADATVLVMPCGRSAHLELGYAVGTGQFTVVLLDSGEPELMYKMCDRLCLSLNEVIDVLAEHERSMSSKEERTR